ncbi:sulfatase-like hydrolase/transferase [bacterium]|nr:sulfatase-like hydrolase/transferase [candidate division CSSED10-310 bacterium]
MTVPVKNQNSFSLPVAGLFVLSGFTVAVIETIAVLISGNPSLNNGTERVLFHVIIWGMAALLSISAYLVFRLSAQVHRRIRNHLFPDADLGWRHIPHFPIFLLLWVFTFADYRLIKLFIDRFHNHAMIAFSIAAIQFIVLACLFLLVAWITANVSRASAMRPESGTLQSPAKRLSDYITNPYLISGIFILILVHANYRWLSLVLNLEALGEFVIFILLIYLFTRKPFLGVNRFLGKQPAARLLIWTAVFLAAVSLLTVNYSYNLPVQIHKHTYITASTLRSAGRILPVNRLPSLVKIPLQRGVFDFRRYLADSIQDYPYDGRPVREIIGDTSDWNILFLSIDAVRADHLSTYGYPHPTSRNLDAFAEQGVLFERNFIQGGDSPRSINSFLSGIYPRHFIPERTMLLKDILKEHGYRTAFVGYDTLFREHPFRKNYDIMHLFDRDYGEIWGTPTTPETVDAIIRILREISDEKFFLYSHLLDPHEAYLPHAETERFKDLKTAFYDGEIAFTDKHLKPLLDFLEESGLIRRTLVVITADHGEEFSDHGDSFHGKHLYNESIHTPLIINFPKLKGRRVKVPVGSVDIVPTLLAFLDIQSQSRLDGTNLLPLIYNGRTEDLGPVFTLVPNRQYRKYGVIYGPWKLIYTQQVNTYELFNIDTDPLEKNNIVDLYLPLAEHMRKMLAEAYGTYFEIPPVKGGGTARSTTAPQTEDDEPEPQNTTSGPAVGAYEMAQVALNEPRDVDFGPEGMYAVADFRNYRVVIFDRNDRFIRAFGSKGNLPGRLNDPCGVLFTDDGFVFIADTFNHRVQKFTSLGEFMPMTPYLFDYPRDLCPAPEGLWVSDYGHDQIVKIDLQGKVLSVLGSRGSAPGQFKKPVGITIDTKGNLIVADRDNRRVQILDPDGKVERLISIEGWEDHPFNLPYLCLDEFNNLYVTDPPAHRILVFDPQTGDMISQFPPPGSTTESPFSYPMGIDYDPETRKLAVVDCRNDRILSFEIDTISAPD